jgi:hypothetical protein
VIAAGLVLARRRQETASNAVIPLFLRAARAEPADRAHLPFGFKREPDRSWWYALNVLPAGHVASTFTMVVPLWFSPLQQSTAPPPG